MTQIQHVTKKEMVRRTGVRNALGYTFPDKDLILLRKDVKGKLKKTVLDHEINHLRKGEEGPFDWGTAIGGGASLLGGALGGSSAKDAAVASGDYMTRQLQKARAQTSPYRWLGMEQAEGLRNWLQGPQSPWAEITSEEVLASPEYQTALSTAQNIGAARGGLQSGNMLRQIHEELAPQGVQNLKRQRYGELQARLAAMAPGMQATLAASGLGVQSAPSVMNALMAGGQAQSQKYRDIAGDIAGLAGQWQGRRDWQDFLSQYPSQPIMV